MSFGLCVVELGWMVVDGKCVLISGCDAKGFKEFFIVKVCKNVCGF